MTTTTPATFNYASIGSVSTGTMRDVDLIDAFGNELESQLLANSDYYSDPSNFNARDRLNDLRGESIDAWNTLDAGDELDEYCDLIERLFDALDEFSPDYVTFGSHPGNGSDYGYWPELDALEYDVRGGELATSQVENGTWVDVNDHGNVTLYVATDGENRELWSCV